MFTRSLNAVTQAFLNEPEKEKHRMSRTCTHFVVATPDERRLVLAILFH